MPIRILGEGPIADDLRSALESSAGDLVLIAGPGVQSVPKTPLVGIYSAYGTALEATSALGQETFSFSYLPPWSRASVVEFSLGPAGPSADAVRDSLAALGKEAAAVGDTPGHVSLRVLAQLVNEAALAVTQGVAGPSELDLAMRLGVNYPSGPVSWGRQVGYPVVLSVLERLTEMYGDTYRPAALLRRWAVAGAGE